MAHIQYVDTLIREYLIYRGFATSLKAFDSDLKSDKDKSFRVDKIIEHISHSINTHDLNSLRDMWNHLDNHLFSKLEQAFVAGKNVAAKKSVHITPYKICKRKINIKKVLREQKIRIKHNLNSNLRYLLA